jgi:DNA-binding GntR family transcriptional regulator
MEATNLAGDAPVLSALPPRDASALVRTVRDRLRLAITLQELPPGTRLNQVRVAEQLGVSRMPVRTAIADLITEGLLEPLPNGGVAVRALTERDVREVYEVRTALEAQAVRRVARLRPPGGLEQISAILERHARLGGVNDAAALLELDRDFHMVILDATENMYFRRAMVPIWSIVERAMVGMLRSIPTMFERAWEQHAEIAEALHAGDARLAESRMRSHLEYSAAQLAAVMADADAAGSTAERKDAARSR